MTAADTPRELARRLNQAIDRSLAEPAEGDVAALRRMAGRLPPQELAERVRLRAVRLGRREARIRERRDALMAAIYGAAVPRGWFVAWCDGSSSRAPAGRAGLGALIVNPQGEVAARIARLAPDLDPFGSEIAALAAVLQAGLACGANRMRVHTDCAALAQLWHARRADPRLDDVRSLARRYRRFELRAVPRRHNEAANRLARQAMAAAAAAPDEAGPLL
jgi:ribonuclease HI